MTVIVRDDGFHEKGREADISLLPDTPMNSLNEYLGCSVISIRFPTMTDGRGFSIARRLRAIGYEGTLRATGHLIADQYAMSRRVGFDEVEISDDVLSRQGEEQWAFRADWREFDHQASLK